MTESDASLVARVRLGDNAAFEVLLRRHFRAAYLVALARVGERADGEAVCREAFLRSGERMRVCRDPERFAAWLIRIVRNTALNRREYLDVRASEALDDAMAAASTRTDQRTQTQELRATLQRALVQLPIVQREVVLLHDLEGWQHADVAARLGISEMMSRRHL